MKRVKGLSIEEFAARNDLVLALPDRIQAIPDGTAAAPNKVEDDDSLRRWKEKLLGCVEGDLNGQMELEVKFHSIRIRSDDIGEIITPLPVAENQSRGLFTLKEGSRYQLKLTFTVLHNIVSGLTYSNTVWKVGLQDCQLVSTELNGISCYGVALEDEPPSRLPSILLLWLMDSLGETSALTKISII